MGKARIGYARNMARKMLKLAGVKSPPVDVYTIVYEQGLTIQEIDVDDSRWSGTFYRSQKTITVNSNHHINRRRFTAAHELGHFSLFHEADEFKDKLGFDGSYGSGQLDDDNSVIDTEQEANEFASELLIPLSMIKKDYALLPVPKELAKTYEVSETAMFVSLLKHRIFK